MFNRADKVEEVDAVSSQLWQTNVVGNIHLFNLFVPLVLKSKVKKVITITTGLADLDLTNECEIDIGSLYAASKAALNVIVAKYNAQYKKDGVLFLAMAGRPGRRPASSVDLVVGLSRTLETSSWCKFVVLLHHFQQIHLLMHL